MLMQVDQSVGGQGGLTAFFIIIVLSFLTGLATTNRNTLTASCDSITESILCHHLGARHTL